MPSTDHSAFPSWPRLLRLLPAVLAPGVATAHGEMAQQQMLVRMSSHPGYIYERCVEIEAGQRLKVQFDTPHKVDFNIHHHTDTATEYPIKLMVENTLNEALSITKSGEYCFMWLNPEQVSNGYQIEFSFQLLEH